MTSVTTLSIVIVNYNVKHFLIKCLESIEKADKTSLSIEIFVVDNASIDGSIVAIRQRFPNVVLIENKINVGFGKANNQAFKIANSTYILALNPDTIIQEDTLQTSVKFMEDNPDCGVMGVKMIDGSGNYLKESKRGLPTIWNSFCKFSGLTSLLPNSKLFSSYYMGHLSDDVTSEVEVLCGAFMFFKSSVLHKLGGFDEDYFMYGEDIDLSQRIKKEGHKVYYLPSTRIIHFKGESTKKASYNYIKNFYNAMLIYVGKNYTGIYGLAMKLMISVGIYLSAFGSFMKNNILSNLNLAFDFTFLFFLTGVMRKVWAKFYFGNEFYFNNSASQINNLTFVLIMIGALWFFGHYDKNWKPKRMFTGLLVGFFISLIVYALLPLSLRSSRALIVLGSILALCVVYGSMIVKSKIYQLLSQGKNKNYLIVADKNNSERIAKIIQANDKDAQLIGTISPNLTIEHNDAFYINTIDKLHDVVKTMNIEHVVFSNADLSLQHILDLMIQPDKDVKYLITGGDDQTVLGSNNKNKNGNLFHAESNYKLSQSFYLRLKRMTDLLLAFSSLLLLPIFIFFVGYRKLIFKNIFSVLSGAKTWVGYVNDEKNITLPKIKNSVFDLNSLIGDREYFPPITNAAIANTFYAKMYTIFIDVKIILKQIGDAG